jgi:hypothetical protein
VLLVLLVLPSAAYRAEGVVDAAGEAQGVRAACTGALLGVLKEDVLEVVRIHDDLLLFAAVLHTPPDSHSSLNRVSLDYSGSSMTANNRDSCLAVRFESLLTTWLQFGAASGRRCLYG